MFSTIYYARVKIKITNNYKLLKNKLYVYITLFLTITMLSIHDAQSDLYESYVGALTEKFKGSDSNERLQILSDLELLVSGQLGNVSSSYSIEQQRNIQTFDKDFAKETRIRAGYSPTTMAREMDVEKLNSARNMILAYENGRCKPKNPPTTKVAREYMLWLKDNGYDPYCLDSVKLKKLS
jgi:hypothetical protein